MASSLNQLKSFLNLKQNKDQSEKSGTSGVEVLGSKRRKTNNDMNDYVIPGPVTHEYFDKSISKFFANDTNQKSSDLKSQKDQLSNLQLTENVLVENVYRMFGITAFPVKKPNSKTTSPELLGIRIEIFNETDLIFETPHYLILQRNIKNSKWNIYKHTVPNFVDVYKIAQQKFDNLSDYYLLDFVKEVRDILNKVAFKHQVVNKLKKDLKQNVKNLEKDIPVEVLKFDLKIPDLVSTPVIINLSLENIESSYIERGFSESEKLRINNVLRGSVKDFQTRLHDVIISISTTA